MNKIKLRHILFLILSLVLIGFTGYLEYTIYTKALFLKSNIKLAVMAGAIVLLLLVLLVYFIHNFKHISNRMSKGQKIYRKVYRILSHINIIIICACLAFSSYTLSNVNTFVDDITADETVTNTINRYYVYTLKDSGVTSLSDPLGLIGIVYAERGAMYSPLNDYLQTNYNKVENTDFQYSYYLNKETLVNGLYNQLLSCVILSEDMYYQILEYDATFMDKTTRIGTIDLVNAVNSKPVDVTSESFNVLLLGVDIRTNEGNIKTDARCDSIIVASFNPKTMAISFVSIPRDSYVLVDGIYDKITHSGNSGLGVVIQTVEDLLGIEINYYAKFNFTALVDVVNALGGIDDIDVKYSFTEQDSQCREEAIHLEAGVQHLNGEQALAYARHRKTVMETDRNAAQQQVIQGIMAKLVSFNSIANFKKLLKAVSNNMLTNFTTTELYELMQLTPDLGKATLATLVIGGTYEDRFIEQYNQTLNTYTIDETSLEQAKAQIANTLG